MPLRCLFSRTQPSGLEAKSEKKRSAAVTQSDTATIMRLSPKRPSTASLKKKPTTATGIIETIILQM